MEKNDKIYVAGHTGLVGSAIVRKLQQEGYNNIITATHEDLDLINQVEVKWFFKNNKIDYVFLCAAKVGGIQSNNAYPVEFLYENMMIEMSVIKYAAENNVKKLLNLGSSCIYPKICSQPIDENELLSGYLETTNEGYALAKISGIKLCEYYNRQYGTNFINVMPCSLFGENESFDLNNSHLIPAIMRKMHEAKINNNNEVEIWGTGKPMREFLYVDDLADACVFLMNNYNSGDLINVGTGKDLAISEIANNIKEIIGFDGSLTYNTSKPDGTMRKVLDCNKITNLGWTPKIEFKDGLKKLYDWYLTTLN